MLNSLNRLFLGESKEDKQSIEQFNEDEVVQLEVEKIIPNQFQPRTIFDDSKISELAQTLKTHGIIQPIVVRNLEDNKYEVIAGERRLRAAKSLKWDRIPAIIRNLTDTETASVALIENIQREQLTAIEEASAYVQLLELHGLTQEALAQRLGKSQSTVANRIRLLKLSQDVQEALLNKEITERHGRSLLKLDEELQSVYLKRIIDEGLNVKELEELINSSDSKEQPKKKKRKKKAKIISKDVRIATNTIKKSLKMITNTGIEVESEEEELDDYYQVTIRIKK
ncbi:MAG TPA: nucleoid occlusion protein [Pseudogracilibacillus sp.]|nr:nucleoid occlusion protein [Pseudogracilibacillus sp.]